MYEQYKLTGMISPAQHSHQRDVGHLFLLLSEGVKAAMGTVFPCGQGDCPSESEDEDMAMCQHRAIEIAKEIFLGLTGKKCKVID
jgi:hypothetical protein